MAAYWQREQEEEEREVNARAAEAQEKAARFARWAEVRRFWQRKLAMSLLRNPAFVGFMNTYTPAELRELAMKDPEMVIDFWTVWAAE